jgi:hypothetical protein
LRSDHLALARCRYSAAYHCASILRLSRSTRGETTPPTSVGRVISSVRLGSPLPAGVTEPLQLLARCAAAGLPVAGGVVVLETSTGSDAELVARLRTLPSAPLDLPPTAYGLDPADIPALAGALRAAFARGGAVLARPQVRSVHAGTAAMRPGAACDVARAVEGQAHEVVGSDDVRTLRMPVLRRSRQRAHRGGDEWRTPLPPWGMRLSRSLRDVRRVLGDRDLDVEWADDGRTCRLLWVSPAA